MLKTKKSKRNDTEFMVGDNVHINNMFYRNHGLKIQDVKGIVRYVVPSWESTIPTVKAIFDFNPSFLQMCNNGHLQKVETRKENGKWIMMVTIRTMYLEKV